MCRGPERLGTRLGSTRRRTAEWKELRPHVLRGERIQRSIDESRRGLGVEVGARRVQRACAEGVRANTTVFANTDPELVAVTRDLARRGVRLATISNCMAEDVAAWPGCAFAPHFECAVFSFAARAVKPNPQIYLETVRQLGVSPADALYIGDGGDDELAGAERAGLRAAQAAWFVSRSVSEGLTLVPPGYFANRDSTVDIMTVPARR